VLRRRKTPDDPLAHVDPGATSPRFAPAVTEALESRRRYLELVDGLRPGPVRDRLERTRQPLDAGVLAVWETALRVTDIERTLATLDPERVTAEYKRAKRTGDEPDVEAELTGVVDDLAALRSALDEVG
jgi:hypothetical protein